MPTAAESSRRARTARPSRSRSGRSQVDERRPGHRRGLRVLVEADRLAGARRGLRVPVLRHRGRAGVQQLRPEKDDCEALADKMGVKAVDDKTLEVKLTTPQPWFIQQVGAPLVPRRNKKAVEQFGDKWTEAANIVTNGPFKLDALGAQLPHRPRQGRRVARRRRRQAHRVNGRMITDGITAVQAFEAGEVDVLYQGLPPTEIARLKETPEYEQYPGLGTYYYGINVKNITDVKQRRAMSLAIPRQSIIDNIAQADQLPRRASRRRACRASTRSTRTRRGCPRNGDLEQAKQLMGEVAEPEEEHHAATSTTRRATARSRSRSRPPGRRSGSTARSSSRSSRSTWSSSGRRRTRTSTSTGSAGSATSSTRSTSSSSGRATRGTTRRTTATRTTTR